MKIKARYSDKCARCGDPIKAGDEVEYDPECKSVMHPSCAIDAEDTEASPIKPAQAGTARYRSPKQEMEYQTAKAEREHAEAKPIAALARIANHKCYCTADDGCCCLDIVQDIAREALK